MCVDSALKLTFYMEMAVTYFISALCIYIRRHFIEGLVIPFGGDEHGLLCGKKAHDQIFHTARS